MTWNENSGGCGIRTWTPGNYVIAFGQRFGTKTIIVDAENTVQVGKAIPKHSSHQVKEKRYWITCEKRKIIPSFKLPSWDAA